MGRFSAAPCRKASERAVTLLALGRVVPAELMALWQRASTYKQARVSASSPRFDAQPLLNLTLKVVVGCQKPVGTRGTRPDVLSRRPTFWACGRGVINENMGARLNVVLSSLFQSTNRRGPPAPPSTCMCSTWDSGAIFATHNAQARHLSSST